jgi:hypothetical protein
MKLLLREDHNAHAARSDVGDRRSVKNGELPNPTVGRLDASQRRVQ